mgnify:CR=1 FL=1
MSDLKNLFSDSFLSLLSTGSLSYFLDVLDDYSRLLSVQEILSISYNPNVFHLPDTVRDNCIWFMDERTWAKFFRAWYRGSSIEASKNVEISSLFE